MCFIDIQLLITGYCSSISITLATFKLACLTPPVSLSISCINMRPRGVNIFKILKLRDHWADVSAHSVGLRTKLLGSGILNFGPCAARGLPKLSPVTYRPWFPIQHFVAADMQPATSAAAQDYMSRQSQRRTWLLGNSQHQRLCSIMACSTKFCVGNRRKQPGRERWPTLSTVDDPPGARWMTNLERGGWPTLSGVDDPPWARWMTNPEQGGWPTLSGVDNQPWTGWMTQPEHGGFLHMLFHN